MRIIKTMGDIRLLKAAGALEPQLLDQAKRLLADIHAGLETATSIEEFTLRDTGPIVVIESGDNVRDLEEIGLNACDDGLLGAVPEWAELMELTGGLKVYNILVVLNDGYALCLLVKQEALDDRARTWLQVEAGIE